jgi:hypothetical protein
VRCRTSQQALLPPLEGAPVTLTQITTYMKPAPPVIIIFLTSGNGSNFVLPIRTGASFQTPKSSKNLFVPAFEVAGAAC